MENAPLSAQTLQHSNIVSGNIPLTFKTLSLKSNILISLRVAL